MIVKNEAHGIVSTLASVRPFIDRWTILDTGSTDGTQDIIRHLLAGTPGELHEEPFIDFATSRNRVLDLHGTQTTFTIMLDSDDRLSGGAELRTFLGSAAAAEDAHLIKRQGETSWWVPLVLRTQAKWRYAGRVHEYLCGPSGQIAASRVPDVSITQVRSQRSAEASRVRWERDLGLLTAEKFANPKDPRTVFYLAQTYECLGRLDEALLENVYRVSIGGWVDETFEAMLRIATLKERLRRPWTEIQQAFLEAYAFDPTRAEPLVAIAEHYRLRGALALCYLFACRADDLPRPRSGLFVDEAVYEWRAADLVAISAYYVGGRLRDTAILERGKRAADRALQARPTDPRLLANRAFYGVDA